MSCCVAQAINQTVQKNLRTLKSDCAAILDRIDERVKLDAHNKACNQKSTLRGLALSGMTCMTVLLLLLLLAAQAVATFCPMLQLSTLCNTPVALALSKAMTPRLEASFGWLVGVLVALSVSFLAAAQLCWRHKPALGKKDLQNLGSFRAYVCKIADKGEVLYEEYFRTLAHAGER